MSSPLSLENGRTTRKAVNVRGTALLWLSFQTLGIIYSDIGTSPLYVLNGIWPSSGPLPSDEDIIGGISAIIWSLSLLPLLKYVIICLQFGTTEGEGGSFALYQGLYPPQHHDVELDRSLTGDLSKDKSSMRSSAKVARVCRWPLLIWCLFGTSLTMADGVFTPAVSVTSAVGGIAVAKPSISSDIIPISIAFLVVLFLAQPFGTHRLAAGFAPVTCLWFLLLAGTGIANITSYPGIFRAFDPSRAVMLFVRTGDYDLLAGILLAVTGCEALFANLGQFNMLSIQLSFSIFVYPALCLAYLGQGAKLITDKENVIKNIFYNTIPGSQHGPLFWIIYVFAILATLIASQALITASFSLVQQLVNFKSLPPIGMVYTSDTIQGQVYIPLVNWTLMVATIVVVAAFKSLTALTNAYGFAVATVMFSTTLLIAIQMHYVKSWPVFVAVGFFLIFGFFDGLFWGASLRKVPHGAWVPLTIGIVLMSLMVFWTWAKGLEDKFDGANRRNLRHFIVAVEDGDGHQAVHRRGRSVQVESALDDSTEEDDEGAGEKLATPQTHFEEPRVDKLDEKYCYLVPKHGARDNEKIVDDDEEKRELTRIPTCAVFHKLAAGRGIPHSFVGFIRQWPALPRVVIFLSSRVLPVARVPAHERYVMTKVHAVQGFYAVTYYHGFREEFDVQVEELIHLACVLETATDLHHGNETALAIKRYATTATHIVPHYFPISRKVEVGRASGFVNWVRALLIEEIYRPLSTMFPETKNWLSSADEMIHVGVNATI